VSESVVEGCYLFLLNVFFSTQWIWERHIPIFFLINPPLLPWFLPPGVHSNSLGTNRGTVLTAEISSSFPVLLDFENQEWATEHCLSFLRQLLTAEILPLLPHADLPEHLLMKPYVPPCGSLSALGRELGEWQFLTFFPSSSILLPPFLYIFQDPLLLFRYCAWNCSLNSLFHTSQDIASYAAKLSCFFPLGSCRY